MSFFSDQEPYELRALREENARLRAEVAACDGHGYLREEIARLRAMIAGHQAWVAAAPDQWIMRADAALEEE